MRWHSKTQGTKIVTDTLLERKDMIYADNAYSVTYREQAVNLVVPWDSTTMVLCIAVVVLLSKPHANILELSVASTVT